MIDPSKDGVRNVYIIDIEDVVVDVEVKHANFFSFIDSYLDDLKGVNWKQLVPHLRRAGLPLPDDYEEREFETEYGHLIGEKARRLRLVKNDPMTLQVIEEPS
jgi:hypothetical protein